MKRNKLMALTGLHGDIFTPMASTLRVLTIFICSTSISLQTLANYLCTDIESPGGMLICKSSQYKATEKVLKEKYSTVLNKMPKARSDLADWPKVREKFIQGQNQWVAFTRNDCAAYFISNDIGQMKALEELACLEKHTLRRIDDLDEWIKWLVNANLK